MCPMFEMPPNPGCAGKLKNTIANADTGGPTLSRASVQKESSMAELAKIAKSTAILSRKKQTGSAQGALSNRVLSYLE